MSFPAAPVFGLGLSAGGGQLQNYMNVLGDMSKLDAGVLLDVGTTWLAPILSMDHRLPVVTKILYHAIARTVRQCGYDLSAMGWEMGNQQNLYGAVQDYFGPLHGWGRTDEDIKKYLRSCAPCSTNCRKPVLVLVNLNDALTSSTEVRKWLDQPKESENVFVCITQNGTHMVRWETWAARCWVCKAAHEFFEAVAKF